MPSMEYEIAKDAELARLRAENEGLVRERDEARRTRDQRWQMAKDAKAERYKAEAALDAERAANAETREVLRAAREAADREHMAHAVTKQSLAQMDSVIEGMRGALGVIRNVMAGEGRSGLVVFIEDALAAPPAPAAAPAPLAVPPEVTCPECGWSGAKSELTTKLTGDLCPKCSVVLVSHRRVAVSVASPPAVPEKCEGCGGEPHDKPRDGDAHRGRCLGAPAGGGR